jgi:hypothetical protein
MYKYEIIIQPRLLKRFQIFWSLSSVLAMSTLSKRRGTMLTYWHFFHIKGKQTFLFQNFKIWKRSELRLFKNLKAKQPLLIPEIRKIEATQTLLITYIRRLKRSELCLIKIEAKQILHIPEIRKIKVKQILLVPDRQERFFFFFLVAICHSLYVYFLSYNTLHMVGSHHTIYDEAWAG